MKLEFSDAEREDLIRGIQMRLCVIETGDPILRAVDARNMGEPKRIRQLNSDQQAVVRRLETLVTRLYERR